MRLADSFSVLSHLINFTIIIYFVSFLLKIKSITISDLFISFFGLFISLIANIMSVLGRNK